MIPQPGDPTFCQLDDPFPGETVVQLAKSRSAGRSAGVRPEQAGDEARRRTHGEDQEPEQEGGHEGTAPFGHVIGHATHPIPHDVASIGIPSGEEQA